MAQFFSLKNSKFFSGLKKICAIVPSITTNKYTLRYLIPASNLVEYVVSKAPMNHPLDRPRHFYTVQSYFP